MRQFTTVLSTAASLAAIAQGFRRSPFSEDWDNAVPQCWFDSPVVCAFNGGPCGAGAACFAGVCFPVSRYQCSDECGEGESLSPLRICECIPDETLVPLFCESDAEESTGGTLVGAETTIHCEDGTTHVCNSGT